MITVERTDFVSVPVQDMERAKTFYSETLGLPLIGPDAGFPEFDLGNVSLYLIDPTKVGGEFAPHSSYIALRVPNVVEARAALEDARGRSGPHGTDAVPGPVVQASEHRHLPVQPLFAQAPGVQRIGASTAGLLSTAEPLVTVLLAYIVLDESLTGWQLAGGALIVAGVAALSLERGRVPATA